MVDVLPGFLQVGRNIPSLVLGAGIFAKLILLILFAMSVIAWSIMVERYLLLRRIRGQDALLKGDFRQADSPDAWRQLAGTYPQSPMAALAARGAELLSGVRHKIRIERFGDLAGLPDAETRILVAMLRDGLERQRSEEVAKLEKNLIFLATTASVSPFFGLLGTVWGIMSSFISMGVAGSASLNVVAPGIAEALITTVAGLAAAIPALIGYNLFVRRIRREENELERFELDMIQTVEAASLGIAGTRRSSSGVVEQESLSAT